MNLYLSLNMYIYIFKISTYIYIYDAKKYYALEKKSLF
jgi:hypothetical protein